MKKTKTLQACVVSCVLGATLLSGCGAPASNDTAAQTEAESTTEETEQPALDLSEGESDFPVGDHVDLDQVLYDENGLKVTATGFGPVNYCVALNLTVENTGDKTMTVFPGLNSLNGWMWDASLVGLDDGRYDEGLDLTLKPGESKECGLGYSNIAYLEPCSIEAFSQIGFMLSATDPETGDVLVQTPELTVDLPDGEGYTQAYDDSGTEIYNEGGIRLVAKGIVETDWGSCEIPVYVENLSDSAINVAPASITVNGTAGDEESLFPFTDVLAGKHALSSPWIEDLTKDSKVEISFRITKIDPATQEEQEEVATTDVVTLTKQ